MGIRSCLLASEIRRGHPELEVFDQVEEIPKGHDARGRIGAWVDGVGRLASQGQAVLWAQHFDAHLCWIASRALGIPMLVTFHGPLFGGDRPNPPDQALGIALGITLAEGVSGVSEEVVSDVGRYTPGRQPALLPNVVDSPVGGVPPPPSGKTFVLATRSEKLGHLRRALEVFAEARAQGQADAFEIVVPSRGVWRPRLGPARRWDEWDRTLKTFGRRWLLASKPSVVRAALSVRFPNAEFSVADRVARATAVLGMGRALLEGAAAGRPCVLIGYEDAHGLLTRERFDVFARTNFSGRRVPVVTPRDVAAELRTSLREAHQGCAWAFRSRSAAEWAPRLMQEVERVAKARVCPEERTFVAGLLADSGRESGPKGDAELFDAVLGWAGAPLRRAYEAAISG